MPARIDPGVRRRHIIEAALRLLVAEGLEGLSLRRVAAEAELNIGSVRHYFDGHQDLLVAVAAEAGDRMGRRLARHPVEELHGLTGEEALNALQALVEELLPLDEERHGEAVALLELILASRIRPVFRPAAARMGEDLSAVLTEAFAALRTPHPERCAAQLSALIGGLTTDAITPHGALSAQRVREILRAQLTMLLASDRTEVTSA